MEKNLKRKVPSSNENPSNDTPRPVSILSMPKLVDMNNLPWDPVDRISILDYHPDQRDEIRRKYWLRGPYQPPGHDFPKSWIGNKERRFVHTWFRRYGKWLEYSVKADKAFCLCCYLYRDCAGVGIVNGGGRDAFMTTVGFSSWNRKKVGRHEDDVNSFHNKALRKCEDLVNRTRSIGVALYKQDDIVTNKNVHTKDDIVKKENRIRLNATVEACRFCLKCALPFGGHDERESSSFKGIFLELMDVIISQNEELKRLPEATGNDKYLCPSTQQDIAHCFEEEVLKSIFNEIGNDVFTLLVDESSDESGKEHMVIVLRYVDVHGLIKARYVGLVQVMQTSSLILKSSIATFFAKYNLSLKRLRGQCYKEPSNMCSMFNGLKTKILEENKSAYYVHCSSHRLRLVVVAVARKHVGVEKFFDKVTTLMNLVASCEEKDFLRATGREELEEDIACGLIETASESNQELFLTHLIDLFSTIEKMLEYIANESHNDSSKSQANDILEYFESFEFVFHLHLMSHVLGLTDKLSTALQMKDQHIIEAVSLVESTKEKLQDFRECGFGSVLEKVYYFCGKHNRKLLSMMEDYVSSRPRRQSNKITNQHYYKFDCFNMVMDMLIQEFGDRFSQVNMELLKNMAALSPRNSFSNFDASKLLRLSEFYPYDFNVGEKIMLEHQLGSYHQNVLQDKKFANLNGIADLAKVMVETGTHISYHLVYWLLKLALVLPVATATDERCFSAIKRVKSSLRNRIGDDFLNACLICAVERDELAIVTNEDVIERFQKMKSP